MEPASQAAEVAAPPVKIAIPKATGTFIPSLKDLSTGASNAIDEEDPYIKGTDKNPFTTDDFLKKWNEYAVKLKKESKMSLFTIFTAEAPVMLKPYDFEVVVSNKAQDNNFRDEKPDLLNFLRVQLKNFDIQIFTRIDETIVTKRPYTDQEKFQHMASRNPQLLELQKSFNLDFN